MSRPFKSHSIDEIQGVCTRAGLSPFRAEQLLVWAYGKGVGSYDEMTNVPKVVREQFDLAFPLHSAAIVERQMSRDRSRKYLLELADGVKVETVGLPSADGRLTVCCSSQAGCAMGCAFCATGKAGLVRDLGPGEIVDQVHVVQKDFGERVTNVVVMGQGEPFANYEATFAALEIMNHPKLLNIGARHITISTCGIVSGIERFTRDVTEDEQSGSMMQYTLAVSLHAARQEVRDELMPAMRTQRLGALRQALSRYADATGRRFSFEYALMRDVNDSEEDLQALIAYCRRLLCHVNLIPLNEIEGAQYVPSGMKVMSEWRDRLEDAGVAVSIRQSRGADIAGACGQLAGKGNTGLQ